MFVTILGNILILRHTLPSELRHWLKHIPFSSSCEFNPQVGGAENSHTILAEETDIKISSKRSMQNKNNLPPSIE